VLLLYGGHQKAVDVVGGGTKLLHPKFDVKKRGFKKPLRQWLM
jgi:hypothetical protein